MSFTNAVFEILCQPLRLPIFSLVGKFQEIPLYSMETWDDFGPFQSHRKILLT